jgi:hypothetical protein
MIDLLEQHLLTLVHVAIAITLVEVLALLMYFRYKQRGVAPSQFLLNLASGLCLMFALRSVLTAAPALITALWLLASGVAHVSDLRSRWNK